MKTTFRDVTDLFIKQEWDTNEYNVGDEITVNDVNYVVLEERLYSDGSRETARTIYVEPINTVTE